MKANWKSLTIAAVTAAVLYYPAMKLFRYMAKKREENEVENSEDKMTFQPITPAYRGKTRAHNRSSNNHHRPS